LKSGDDGVNNVPIGFKGSIGKALVVFHGSTEAAEEGGVVATQLDENIGVVATEAEEMVKEPSD
jgi:hypothetical protein